VPGGPPPRPIRIGAGQLDPCPFPASSPVDYKRLFVVSTFVFTVTVLSALVFAFASTAVAADAVARVTDAFFVVLGGQARRAVGMAARASVMPVALAGLVAISAARGMFATQAEPARVVKRRGLPRPRAVARSAVRAGQTLMQVVGRPVLAMTD
jgi:hypothetical protein